MGRNINTLPFMLALGGLATIAITVLIYIFILPEKKEKELPTIGKKLRDFLLFKELYIEKIFRFFYVLSTIGCIACGAAMIFGFSSYRGYYSSHTQWYGGYGILLMLVGPIAMRIAYEGIMMGILLVKNVLQINNTLTEMKNSKEMSEDSAEKVVEVTPAVEPTYEEVPVVKE